MKKAILSMMVLAALSTKTNAQLKDNVSLGPIVGFGHSWLSNDLANGFERKFQPLLNVGGRLVYSATPNLGVGLDGTFRTEGTTIKASSLETKTNLNYIRLDPKLYYFFGKYGQALRPKIGIGPSFGFLVGGKIKSENTSGGTAFPEIKSKDYFNGFDFGLSGSVGFNYRLKSKTWLNIDLVYNNGFTEVAKNNNGDAKNRSLFLNAGVTFGIGHAGKK